MQYRVKKTLEAGCEWYYPQYKRFIFWRNFRECYCGVKWVRWWSPFFDTVEDAERFLSVKKELGSPGRSRARIKDVTPS